MISTDYKSLLTAATTVAAGAETNGVSGVKSYEASGTTTSGAGSATIKVRGRNSPSSAWQTIGTITLTLGTTVTGDGFASDDRYALLSGEVTAISGTGASVNLTMGY